MQSSPLGTGDKTLNKTRPCSMKEKVEKNEEVVSATKKMV